MRKSSLVSLVILFAVTMLLNGCIFPYWWDGHGGRGGGHHDDGGGRGHRGGGGGRH